MREPEEPFEVAKISSLKQLIAQHRSERRRKRYGEPKRDLVVRQSPHHSKKRQIALAQRLKKPIFFEEILVLGMSDKREVSVKNGRNQAGHEFKCSLG